MSLLFTYDFEKHTMITLASIAISLTVGLLMQYAYGISEKENMINELIKSGEFTEEEAEEFVKMFPDVKDDDNRTSAKEPTGIFKSKTFTVKDLKTVRLDNRYEIQGTIKYISNETLTRLSMSVQTYDSSDNENGLIIHFVKPPIYDKLKPSM